MKSRFIYLLYVLLALAVVTWGYRLLESDSRKLQRRLDELAQLLEKDASEGDLVAANKGRLVGAFFSRDFEVQLVPFGGQHFRDRAQLAQAVLGYRRQATRIRVSFHDSQIEMHDDGAKTGDMHVKGTVSGTESGQLRRETYRFYLRWIEEDDGVWRIEQADLLEVIESPF